MPFDLMQYVDEEQEERSGSRPLVCQFSIGGGYLVWLWLKEKKGWVLGLFGGIILFFYGVIPTFQPAN